VLVLTRKANQSIMIGDGIEVSVLAVMGEKVRIGIEAPRSVPVFRQEVWIEIQRDRAESGEDHAESDARAVQDALAGLKRPADDD
jgi:carbon storage regulator